MDGMGGNKQQQQMERLNFRKGYCRSSVCTAQCTLVYALTCTTCIFTLHASCKAHGWIWIKSFRFP